MKEGVEHRELRDVDQGYFISAEGFVWSTKQKRYLKNTPCTNGFLRVTLRKNKKNSQPMVAQLVLNYFIGPPTEGANSPIFKDGNRANCDLSNLSWGARIHRFHRKKPTGRIPKKVYRLDPITKEVIFECPPAKELCLELGVGYSLFRKRLYLGKPVKGFLYSYRKNQKKGGQHVIIPHYRNRYELRFDGLVYDVVEGCYLTPTLDEYGRDTVTLISGRGETTEIVSHLVMGLYGAEKVREGQSILHLDRNKQNHLLNNLQIINRSPQKNQGRPSTIIKNTIDE